ncbi:MAG: M23 family metallopeptidase [bacterium]|nr:M23 family metallopeptidase [bacterium]
MNKARFFCVILILLLVSASAADARFMWPIARAKRITGTFGEFRGTRFHHGLDISCGGMKGFKIYASDTGYVSSVMFRKWGIGYALFIKHKNGYSTMYGHMDRFSRRILKNKKMKKYSGHIRDRADFLVEFDKNEFPVSRGAVIGYSGESGIGIEHFHFEMRDAQNRPVNPLTNGIRVPDRSAPVIREVHLVPMDGYSHVDGFSSIEIFEARRKNKKKNRYGIRGNDIPVIGGKVGVKIQVYDKVAYVNKVSIHRIEFFVNKKLKHSIRFDRINKNFTYRMGLFYDYAYSDTNTFTFFLYSRRTKEGILSPQKPGSILNLKIACYDANNNRSVFYMKLKTAAPLKKPEYYYKPNLLLGDDLELRSRDKVFSLAFDEKAALYNEMVFLERYPSFRTSLRKLTVKSRVYALFPINLCIDTPARIRIKYSGKDYKKVGVYAVTGKKDGFYFMGNNYDRDEEAFIVKTRKIGKFFLVKDEYPPKVWYKKRKIRKGRSIKFYLRDLGTGPDLGNVYLRVDGKKVIWDYNPDKHYIEILPHNKIWKKGKHRIVIQVPDGAGNKSKKKVVTYRIR